MDEDLRKNLIKGTQERRTEVLRIGSRVVKVAIYEEQIDEEGVLERKNVDERSQLDCGHMGNVGGVCSECNRYFCEECAKQYGTCFVCGALACPNCSESTVLDKNKRYHKSCWLESVKRKIFG